MKKTIFLLTGGLLLMSLMTGSVLDTTPSGSNKGFIKAQGEQLILSNTHTSVRLQGVNISYSYWGTNAEILRSGNGSKDYENIKAMGMNTVRLNLNHQLLETANPQSEGWLWLDRNIKYAANNGLYVILDMHIPIGSDWLSAEGDQDFSIWTDPEKQKQFKSLWKAIATRYKNNTTVAAYDLFNEPITQDTDGQTYRKLIDETVAEIRRADPNHLLIIERLYGTNKGWNIPETTAPQFLVADSNVMYDFHFYSPFEYTHQYAPWSDALGDGGIYPDPLICTAPDTAGYKTSKGSILIQKDSSNWTYIQTPPVSVKTDDFTLAAPAFYCEGDFESCWFSDMYLTEINSEGTITRTLPLPFETQNLWYWWSEDNTGQWNIHPTAGPKGKTAVSISQVGKSAGLVAKKSAFVFQKGYSYQLTGWVKGDRLKENAHCSVQMDYYTAKLEDVVLKDRASLAKELDRWTAFGKENNVPVNVGEWGLIYYCFKNDKGGLTWVKDMLDLFQERNLNFQYWDYNSEYMGIYKGNAIDTIEKAEPNQELIHLFKIKLQK